MRAQGVHSGPGASGPPNGTRGFPTWISCQRSRPPEPFPARKFLGPGVALPQAQPQGTELMAQAGVQTPRVDETWGGWALGWLSHDVLCTMAPEQGIISLFSGEG